MDVDETVPDREEMEVDVDPRKKGKMSVAGSNSRMVDLKSIEKDKRDKREKHQTRHDATVDKRSRGKDTNSKGRDSSQASHKVIKTSTTRTSGLSRPLPPPRSPSPMQVDRSPPRGAPTPGQSTPPRTSAKALQFKSPEMSPTVSRHVRKRSKAFHKHEVPVQDDNEQQPSRGKQREELDNDGNDGNDGNDNDNEMQVENQTSRDAEFSSFDGSWDDPFLDGRPNKPPPPPKRNITTIQYKPRRLDDQPRQLVDDELEILPPSVDEPPSLPLPPVRRKKKPAAPVTKETKIATLETQRQVSQTAIAESRARPPHPHSGKPQSKITATNSEPARNVQKPKPQHAPRDSSGEDFTAELNAVEASSSSSSSDSPPPPPPPPPKHTAKKRQPRTDSSGPHKQVALAPNRPRPELPPPERKPKASGSHQRQESQDENIHAEDRRFLNPQVVDKSSRGTRVEQPKITQTESQRHRSQAAAPQKSSGGVEAAREGPPLARPKLQSKTKPSHRERETHGSSSKQPPPAAGADEPDDNVPAPPLPKSLKKTKKSQRDSLPSGESRSTPAVHMKTQSATREVPTQRQVQPSHRAPLHAPSADHPRDAAKRSTGNKLVPKEMERLEKPQTHTTDRRRTDAAEDDDDDVYETGEPSRAQPRTSRTKDKPYASHTQHGEDDDIYETGKDAPPESKKQSYMPPRQQASRDDDDDVYESNEDVPRSSKTSHGKAKAYTSHTQRDEDDDVYETGEDAPPESKKQSYMPHRQQASRDDDDDIYESDEEVPRSSNPSHGKAKAYTSRTQRNEDDDVYETGEDAPPPSKPAAYMSHGQQAAPDNDDDVYESDEPAPRSSKTSHGKSKVPAVSSKQSLRDVRAVAEEYDEDRPSLQRREHGGALSQFEKPSSPPPDSDNEGEDAYHDSAPDVLMHDEIEDFDDSEPNVPSTTATRRDQDSDSSDIPAPPPPRHRPPAAKPSLARSHTVHAEVAVKVPRRSNATVRPEENVPVPQPTKSSKVKTVRTVSGATHQASTSRRSLSPPEPEINTEVHDQHYPIHPSLSRRSLAMGVTAQDDEDEASFDISAHSGHIGRALPPARKPPQAPGASRYR
ncbi:hypothetical protein ONZ45_g13792 [Pleurotus djamor]|nr:hypothetical protein ONZ45_g13792 [Pleurotus djamor]